MAGRYTEKHRKPINLALQGGGAHGSFAWGVLDRILEERCFEVKGIVGTSAGAMNASVTACGLALGGDDGAREKLTEFWTKISRTARRFPLQASWFDKLHSPGNLEFSPLYAGFDMMTKFLSPYQWNPTNQNPLGDILADVLDIELMHREEVVKLFICASNVMSGKIRVFTEKDLSIKAILASACLPFLFQAVEIDGEYFWDGGYMGNPPLYPLIYHTDCADILVIQLNPIAIRELPKTPKAILDRINTLSFNSSLMREMRVIDFVSKLIDGGFDNDGQLRKMLIHTIDGQEVLGALGVSSKLNADMDFLKYLFDEGRAAAEEFLDAHYDKVGVRSSTDIAEKFC